MSRPLAIILACLFSTAAQAACPAGTPVDTARWIYTNHHDFYVSGKGGPEYLSKNLLGLLKKDWSCQQPGDQCAISADPWTGTQDNEVIKAVEWKQVSSSDKQAVVEMVSPLGASTQSTILLLIKNPGSQCWVLDNIQSPDDVSLVQTLQDFPYEGD
ncbi:hypothetical protein PSCICO_32890 [Pseudomonas cichorii]|uniref:DUF3828 domain-containing protein n=1 Tax=Pseudomonas serbiensis TaxID=3064350 RepID=A0ABT9CW28_9PSED|nr:MULTISPECIES: DUF3828 domain-containing protein [Pseudomonas]MDO7927967.1 DUF3828 domain-containing protein [Pseudomonas sp. KFB-138]GFM87890.1 hypothetical protein PSCICO_32890 [Pseudomonas cichorii]